MEEYLLLRPDDQLVLGVAWSGLTGAPRLEAGPGAVIELTLPPQHTGEQVSTVDSAGVLRAVLAGPSRVTFAIPAGTRVEPTAAGILALLDGLGVQPSAVELPWRFAVSPTGPDGRPALAAHAAAPVTAEGVSGLWRMRLHADGGLRLVPVDRHLAELDDPFAVPLHRDLRTRLFREAAAAPPPAERLELGPLGGSLRAAGTWPAFHWAHEAVLGRDMRVETVTGGMLFPTGHRAVVTELVQRVVDPGGAAVLRRLRVVAVQDRVRSAPAEPRLRRAFPFDAVELAEAAREVPGEIRWQRHAFGGAELDAFFRIEDQGGDALPFTVVCTAGADEVHLRLPLLFVADLRPAVDSLSDPALAARLAEVYGAVRVPLPGTGLDLARSDPPRDGDRHEVHELAVGGSPGGDGYRPVLRSMSVALPALRVLLGDDRRLAVKYGDGFLDDTDDVLLELLGAASLVVGFGGAAERSGGLAVPQYAANALSRGFGPVRLGALPDAAGTVPSRLVLGPAATLFGVPLLDLIAERMPQPRTVAVPRPGAAPAVTMSWPDVRLADRAPFEFGAGSRLAVTAEQTGDGVRTTCVLEHFALRLPLGRPLLRLSFAAVRFTQEGSGPPRLEIEGLAAEFLNELQLLEELGKAVDLAGAGLTLTAGKAEITAAYRLPLPPVRTGAFVLSGAVLRAGLTVPFDARPVTVSLGFASREAPFAVAVLMFGGGGYVDVELDHRGLRRMEAALEFGALVELDFVVARATVHALGGVRYVLAADGSVELAGYLRIGGCVDVLGLVSVSIELCVALAYRSRDKALVGRATLVVEIDLTLWSQSVELDSGAWVLTGGSAPPAQLHGAGGRSPADEGLRRWQAYRAAFAGEASP
ncbi:hypothetical protein [Dactylosporangium sp. CA-092794]|uniref:hypothetical protein n=1 Tax=Dactylosporangium sp. CA-092794 TaxID=3239929 RepID=UPI003D901580